MGSGSELFRGVVVMPCPELGCGDEAGEVKSEDAARARRGSCVGSKLRDGSASNPASLSARRPCSRARDREGPVQRE